MFIRLFRQETQRRGMQLPDPIVPEYTNVNMDKIFAQAAEYKVEFVLLIDPLSEKTHGILKYLVSSSLLDLSLTFLIPTLF